MGGVKGVPIDIYGLAGILYFYNNSVIGCHFIDNIIEITFD